jgi:hypothetical protein
MRTRISFLTLVLSVGAAYGSVVVAPNANAAANGNSDTLIVFSEGTQAWNFQWQLAASQLTAMVGDTISAIGFRLDAGSASFAAGTSIGSWDLELSGAANALGSMSTTLANNIGAGATTVYNNSLVLPAMTGGAGPNPFFLITFTTPYTYTGGDLLMTLSVLAGGANNNVVLDANTVDSHGDTAGGPVGTANQAQFFNYPITEFQFNPTTAVPEPGSLLLFLGGGLALAGAKRRKQSDRA